MKILLSPAKSLDYTSPLPTTKFTTSEFLSQTLEINQVMKQMSEKQLADLMGISSNLAELNYARFADFSENFNKKNSRPALFAFAGDVYTGLDAYTLKSDEIERAQNQIRILSGMYGMLKPLDLLQPYRLEMGTKVQIGEHKNLYQFWKETLTAALNKELKNEEIVVNLASNEYFKVIDKKTLNGDLIHPIFKDYKNGKLKTIAFYAKKARGAMARHLIEHKNSDIKTILKFNSDGYAYSESDSADKYHPTFIR